MKFNIIYILSFLLFSAFAPVEKTNTDIADGLFEAIENIDIVSLNILLAEGADIDTVDNRGNTPLIAAAKIGNSRMVRIILAHNPNVNQKNIDGYTALMIAAENGHEFVVQQLLKQGARTDMKNNKGLSAQEVAKRNGHASTLSILSDSNDVPFSR